jgi:predicted nucleic acid-binding protein
MIRLYWDSCTFISRIQGDPRRIVNLEFLTDEAAAGKLQLVTSALTVAEVSHLRRECSEAEMLRDVEEIGRFFDNDYIHVVQLTRHIATEAAKISLRHKIKPPDAIHLATALHSNCQVVHTYDEPMLRLDGKVGAPALTITTPPAAQRGLFDDQEVPDADEEPEPAIAVTSSLAKSRCEAATVCGTWLVPSRRVWGRPVLLPQR